MGSGAHTYNTVFGRSLRVVMLYALADLAGRWAEFERDPRLASV